MTLPWWIRLVDGQEASLPKDQHDQQLRLVRAAEGLSADRTEAHGCYANRPNRDELGARLALYPLPRERVSNVIPLRRPEPPKPAA